MNKPLVRIIYPPSRVSEREVQAVARGVKRFERFGVLCETREASHKAVRDVKRGGLVHRAVTSETAVTVNPMDLQTDALRYILHEKVALGLGVTPVQLFGLNDSPLEGASDLPTREALIGVGKFDASAILSLFRFRQAMPDEQLRLAAIELAAVHETGHLFIDSKGVHCQNDSCVMQENRGLLDFLERFVKPQLDFCRECAGKISVRVSIALSCSTPW